MAQRVLVVDVGGTHRFGTKDDGPANVQLGEEGRKRLAL